MRKLFIVLAALLVATSAHAAALLGAISQGNPPGPSGGTGTAPVVASKACTVSSGFTNGQLVQQVHGAGSCSYSATCAGVACSGANAITSWAITSQSSASAFAITSTVGAGELTGGTNAANVTTGSYTVTVTATNSTGTSPGVTQTITAYPDGTVGAPGGVANAAQLFSNGTNGGTGGTYTVRPPWNVVGVDYRSGYDTTLTLKDPASGGFPACVTSASTSNHIVEVGGNGPCTISGYDFSLEGGWILAINTGCSSGAVTIQNNNFVIGTNFGPTGIYIISSTSTGCPVNLISNTIDGAGCNYENLASLTSFDGQITSRYNQYLNSPGHSISIQQSGTGLSFVSQYDYIRIIGNSPGIHANPYIFNTPGSFTTVNITYDVVIIPSSTGDQSAVGVCPASYSISGAGSSGNVYLSPDSPSNLSGVVVENNTLIASPVRGGTQGFDTFILRCDESGTTVTSPLIENNYYDVTGILVANTPYLLTTCSSPTISGNILLTNGHSCNANGSCT